MEPSCCLHYRKKADVADVLKFPRTPILLASSVANDCVFKTNKSTSLKNLAPRVQLLSPLIVDSIFILYLLPNMPEIFRDVARHVL